VRAGPGPGLSRPDCGRRTDSGGGSGTDNLVIFGTNQADVFALSAGGSGAGTACAASAGWSAPSTFTSTLNRKPTDSSLMPSSIVMNMS